MKGPDIQNGPITRKLYVRPPCDFYSKRGLVWKLLKAPYGFFDAGFQWAMKIEYCILCEAKLERVFGDPKLFVRKEVSTIRLIVTKVTDDFLFWGKIDDIEVFMNELKNAFYMGKVSLGDNST